MAPSRRAPALAAIENLPADNLKEVKSKKEPTANSSKALKEEIERLTSQLTDVKIEAAKKDEALLEKDAANLKLQQAVKKLKAKQFEPTVDFSYLEEASPETNDPRKPKPPISAYIRYCNNVRKDVSEGLPPTEVMKKLAEMWKGASEAEKAPFEAALQLELEAYLPLKAAYDQILKKEKAEHRALDLLQEEKRAALAKELLIQYETYHKEQTGSSLSKKKKDPEKPTAAKSAWVFFMEAQWAKCGQSEEKVPRAEQMSKIALLWKDLAPEDRAAYDEMATTDKERCRQEMEVYNLKKEEENAKLKAEQDAKHTFDLPAALDLVKKLEEKKMKMKKTEQLASERREGLKEQKLQEKIAKALIPKKPKNAWGLFMTEKRKNVVEENPTMGFGEVSTKVGALWKALAPEEKKKYEEKAGPALTAYKVEMARYREAHPEAVSTTTSVANSRATSVAAEDVADLEDVADAPEE